MRKKKKIIIFKDDLKTYKELNISYRVIALFTAGITIALVAIIFLLANSIFSATHNYKMRKLKRANEVLWTQIGEIKTKLEHYAQNMDNIIQKDEQLRLALNIPSINSEVRSVGVGGTEIANEFSNYSELFSSKEYDGFKSVIERVDKLEKEVNFEIGSYEDLVFNFKQKEDSVKYIPCINPLKGFPITSRFGMRLHPIQKVLKMHHGVDILANVGTPIYAPADGIVKFVGKVGGYGTFLRIDHLKGFETRYGHMSKINVKIGQKVKRGEKIAEAGNEGISTGPHLHYEILYHKTRLNPAEFMID